MGQTFISIDRLLVAFAFASTFQNKHLMSLLAPLFAKDQTPLVHHNLERTRKLKKVGSIKIESEDIESLVSSPQAFYLPNF